MAFEPIYYALHYQPIIGRSFKVGHNVLIDGHAQITIGDDVFLGHHVMLLTGGHDPEQRGAARQAAVSARPIIIGDGVWICSGAIVCPGVTIGAHSVVGPGAVVMRNVPAYTIVGGNPARKIRRLAR
jgi:maltose O-acetyltransferase